MSMRNANVPGAKSIVLGVLGLLILQMVLFFAPARAYALDACPADYDSSMFTRESAVNTTEVPGAPNTFSTTYRYTDPTTKETKYCEKITSEIPKSKSVSCAGTLDKLLSPGTCLTRALFAGIGSFLMWVGIQLATLSGTLFEFALKHAVVQFAVTLTFLKESIDTGWTVFRDIANIVIIGMFVFIAINIILGVEEFGKKKYVARVLIVAVLINFSLLFTKIIIDASNFVAYQFHNSMVAEIDSGSASLGGTFSSDATGGSRTAADARVSAKGVAAKYMQYLGVQGIADSYSMLRGIQEGNNDAILGLGYGLLSFIFLIAVAAVFFYGSFLIISRAILLIFLMLVAALAFASWLIPHHLIEEGWSKWWRSLLKSALFAPVLMALLWMNALVSSQLSQKVAQLAGTGSNKGTLGAIAANPSSEVHVAALFGFVLILGLLFASFKAASVFASGIAGFSYAAMLPALGIAGASRLAGVLGRNSGGFLADYAAHKANRWGARAMARGQVLRGTLIDRFARRPLDSVAGKDFNLMNTAAGKAIAKTAGMDKLGETKFGGYKKLSEEMAKEYAKAAEGMGLDKTQKSSIVAEAEAHARGVHGEAAKEIASRKEAAKAEKEAAEVLRDANASAAVAQKAPHEAEKSSAKAQEQAIRSAFEKEIHEMREQLATETDDGKRAELNERLKTKQQTQEQLLEGQKMRIERATKAIGEIDAAAEAPIKAAQEKLQKAESDEKELETKIGETMTKYIEENYPNVSYKHDEKDIDKRLTMKTGDVAAQMINVRATNLFGGFVSVENDRLAQKTRKKFNESSEEKRLKKVLAKQIEDEEKKHGTESVSKPEKKEAGH